jgi:hypothetical protein
MTNSLYIHCCIISLPYDSEKLFHTSLMLILKTLFQFAFLRKRGCNSMLWVEHCLLWGQRLYKSNQNRNYWQRKGFWLNFSYLKCLEEICNLQENYLENKNFISNRVTHSSCYKSVRKNSQTKHTPKVWIL